MKFYKNIKRTTMQYIIVSVICILIMGGAAFFTSFVFTNHIKEEYNALLEEAYSEMESNKRTVYIAASEITSGEVITEDKVIKKTVYAAQPQNSYMSGKELGQAALINITKDTHILKAMLTENAMDSGMREMEYQVVNLNSNIENFDTVDLRIFFPNGEDYIVLSKKVIKGIAPDFQSCLLWLSEEEILRMSSAIVDAYLYTGTKIYTTKYIEPTFQEASRITYEPSVSTLMLIEDNPNIVETAINEVSKLLRKAMENRLADSFHTKVEDIAWELTPNQLSVKKEAADNAESVDTQEPSAKAKETKSYFEPSEETPKDTQKKKENEVPAVISSGENITYQDEQRDREKDPDYGP